MAIKGWNFKSIPIYITQFFNFAFLFLFSIFIDENSGWFGIGGIWNKLSMKPKNQMILPDDKNPAVSIELEKNMQRFLTECARFVRSTFAIWLNFADCLGSR